MILANGKQKLRRDLEILEAMAAGMGDYLLTQTLWQTIQPQMPQLTLGGYLMRQHRLQALRDSLLDSAEQERLARAVAQFEQALVGKGSYFEKKAGRELEARLRQWEAYLRDLAQDPADQADFYGARVEVRAMIAALVDGLTAGHHRLETAWLAKRDALDEQLRQQWAAGPFVWPAEWQPAYPPEVYWWLYGAPAR